MKRGEASAYHVITSQSKDVLHNLSGIKYGGFRLSFFFPLRFPLLVLFNFWRGYGWIIHCTWAPDIDEIQ
jgi:hypothetical protein